MTNTNTNTNPRRKKAHPARTARTVSTAVAATLSFGLVGALSLSAASNASSPSAAPTPTPLSALTAAGPAVVPDISLLESPTTAPVVSATPNTVVVIVRRIHYLPSSAPSPAVAAKASSASTFTPKAAKAARAVATPVRQRVVRRVAARRATTKAS